MSVALKKVEGIESVNVTLKRGVAHIVLKPENSVSLPDLRRIIKDAGYTTKDADVTVRGMLVRRGNDLVLEVTGTRTVLRVTADPTAPDAVARLHRSAGGAGLPLELSGTVPAAGNAQVDILRLRSFTIDP